MFGNGVEGTGGWGEGVHGTVFDIFELAFALNAVDRFKMVLVPDIGLGASEERSVVKGKAEPVPLQRQTLLIQLPLGVVISRSVASISFKLRITIAVLASSLYSHPSVTSKGKQNFPFFRQKVEGCGRTYSG